LKAALRRALVSGTAASVLSTVAISLASRIQGPSSSAGTNATSHWVWGGRAKRQRQATLRYTALGYAIHHLSSVFWASSFEYATHRATRLSRVAAAAVVTAASAYVVDYHVVPKRLNPGFERHLSPVAMTAVYAAFALGLLAGRLQGQPSRRAPRTARAARNSRSAGTAHRIIAGSSTPAHTAADNPG